MRHSFVQLIKSGNFPRACRLRRSGHAENATIVRRLSLRSIGCGNKDDWKVPNKSGFPSRESAAFFSSRPDPFARRPTSKCDPYGQSGKPLTLDEVLGLAKTIEPEWKIVMTKDDRGEDATKIDTDDEIGVPFAIRRVYWHDDYLQGAQFSTHVAAVAQMNAQHFPHQVILSRQLESKTKTWKICTEVLCRTHVLQGLSHHDFYLATLIDIEAQRPEVRGLLSLDDRFT